MPHRGYLAVAKALDAFVPVSYPLSCMLTNSGAEATENALKVARAATGRQAVIAFDDGFHGRTLAALNLNGKVKPYKNALGILPGPVYHLPFPSQDGGVTAGETLARLFEVEVPAEEVAFFHYRLTESGKTAGRVDSRDPEDLIARGLVVAQPLTYEDFLPVSAAGIFQSNLGGDQNEAYAGNANREALEAALGAPVTDELALYAERERASRAAVLQALSP